MRLRAICRSAVLRGAHDRERVDRPERLIGWRERLSREGPRFPFQAARTASVAPPAGRGRKKHQQLDWCLSLLAPALLDSDQHGRPEGRIPQTAPKAIRSRIGQAPPRERGGPRVHLQLPRAVALHRHRAANAPPGPVTVTLDFAYDGGGAGKGGKATLYVNGKQVAEGRVEKTQPNIFSADETADVGIDNQTPVAEGTVSRSGAFVARCVPGECQNCCEVHASAWHDSSARRRIWECSMGCSVASWEPAWCRS